MSTIKRVPLGFDHPLNETWPGYVRPERFSETVCRSCEGSGYSQYAMRLHDQWYGNAPFDPASTGSPLLTVDTPVIRAWAERQCERDPGFYGRGEQAVRREAERVIRMWNSQWNHHLSQDDVDALVAGGRLRDFTHQWSREHGWVEREPKSVVTAAQVNEWSIGGFGHDAINAGIVIRAACERAGEPELCALCEGEGSAEAYPGQRAEAEAWKATDPPTGEGWQRWEFVGDGSPTSPVFATPEALADWMCTPASAWGAQAPMKSREAALSVVLAGGGGNFLISTSNGEMISADEALARADA